uniref:TNase-like domain-containing protein n=1 Tax=Aegilops tauschii subsp. strangulata TaxID=200361 RepID=A0A453E3S8_AEGTS
EKADTLQKIIVDAGYRQVPGLTGEQVLAKKYRVRLRGIDAPENSMPYGREAKEELVKLVQGRTLKISIYDTDRYGRLVGDVDCNGVFVQIRTYL